MGTCLTERPIIVCNRLPNSVWYRTGNHYRLSEYTGRLIIDYTIENYTHFTKKQ